MVVIDARVQMEETYMRYDNDRSNSVCGKYKGWGYLTPARVFD